MKSLFLSCLILAVALAQAPAEAPVEVRIPIAPAAVKANNQTVLAYELHLTNFLPREITLNRVDVFGEDAGPIATYQDDDLINSIVPFSPSTKIPDPRRMAGGMRSVLFIWLKFDKSEAVPRSLRHKLFFAIPKADGKVEDRNLEISGLEVSRAAPVVIPPPIKGGTWIAVNGPSNSSVHRRALIVAGGQVHLAQRFAIDWIKLSDDGKLWHGDPKINAAWYGYGVEVLAVADGVVASIKDGVPQNIPFSPTRAVPITLETIGGNYVILAIGKGQFAYYAHLQPGSLRVKPGDRVRRGQVLGLLGNSGNSDAPHLHFHIVDENSANGSEGRPYVFESFETLGVADMEKTFSDGWTMPAGSKPEKHLREIPIENAVVKFP